MNKQSFKPINKAMLKSKIEKILFEILSDRHNAKIVLTFTKKEDSK